jgi:hypothetical protein
VVGVTGTAACPTNVGFNQVAGGGGSGPFVVFGAGGSCSSYSANTQGTFTVNGAGPGTFSSSCQTSGLESGSSVTVPPGTMVNGTTVSQPTVVDTFNTPVVFPNGVAATLNVRTVSGQTVTQTAIVSGGTLIGRVICGAANVYPLAVDTAAPAVPPVLPAASSGGNGGMATGTLLALGAFALVVAAQLAIGRGLRRRKGDATG